MVGEHGIPVLSGGSNDNEGTESSDSDEVQGNPASTSSRLITSKEKTIMKTQIHMTT